MKTSKKFIKLRLCWSSIHHHGSENTACEASRSTLPHRAASDLADFVVYLQAQRFGDLHHVAVVVDEESDEAQHELLVVIRLICAAQDTAREALQHLQQESQVEILALEDKYKFGSQTCTLALEAVEPTHRTQEKLCCWFSPKHGSTKVLTQETIC